MNLKKLPVAYTFPSVVNANKVCSPPISCTGRRDDRASQAAGNLTLAPSIPPSCPL